MVGNPFEKIPTPKIPEEKEKDLQEWRKHFGIQAEMTEEQEKAEEKKKQEQAKDGQNKEWREHFGVQAEIAEEMEKAGQAKTEKEKEWLEHFGPLAELQEEAEKISGVPKQEKPVEPVKVAEPEREPLTKTELDPEYVLGERRAKLADELGERIRAKSAGEIKVAEKESPQKQEKQEKQEKVPFFLKGFLKELDMQQSLKLVEAIEKFAKKEKSKESKEELAAKREKHSFSLKDILGELDKGQTIKLVEAVEKAVKKEKPLFSLQRFLEKRRWKKVIKDTEKLRKKIEERESKKKLPTKEKLPISLKEVLKKLNMNKSSKLWKSAEEFVKNRKGGESWGKFLEKIEESKRDMKWRLKTSKWRLEDWLKEHKSKKAEKPKEEPLEPKTEIATEEVLPKEPPKDELSLEEQLQVLLRGLPISEKLEETEKKPPEVAEGESEEIRQAKQLYKEADGKSVDAFGLLEEALLKNDDYAKSKENTNNALNDWSGGEKTDILWEKYMEAVGTRMEIKGRLIKADPDIAKLNENEIKANDLTKERKAALEKLLNK